MKIVQNAGALIFWVILYHHQLGFAVRYVFLDTIKTHPKELVILAMIHAKLVIKEVTKGAKHASLIII